MSPRTTPRLIEKMMARITSPHAGKRLKGKVGDMRKYFGSKEHVEKAKARQGLTTA
jgi:hypothetical protein